MTPYSPLLSFCLFILLAFLPGCDKPHTAQMPTAGNVSTTEYTPTPIPPATKQAGPAHYVGSDHCKLCHLNQYNDWDASDHHHAMAPATPATVLGHFPDTLQHHQQQTQFLAADGRFTVTTDQQTALPAEQALQYTFGIFPLQQYLTALPDGRLQSLPFAWDSRNKEIGGQQWFHLYADENLFPGDALHWRSNSHNANHMCIECHTTNFQKNFSSATGQFASQWLEMGVGCESCHGPASNHLAWTTSPEKPAFINKGWDFNLTSGSPGLWQTQTATTKPQRKTQGDNTQVEQCAQCHSRRSRIDASNHAGSFFNTFTPSLLDASLYYPDGQINDEVYEYASFLQSRMHTAGVTCSNCHNPHSGKVRIEGNGLCLQCHDASHDTPAHTLHQPLTPGSACIDCHMPAKTYMQVDSRRDHSFRIPRPDLSASTGSPDACQQCHQDKSHQWAAQVLSSHTGNTAQAAHYGTVFHAAQNGVPAAFDKLAELVKDPQQAVMVRATAASLLGHFPTRDPRQTLSDALASSEPLIRLGALQASEALPPEERRILLPLLSDKLKAIRIEAARLTSVVADIRQQPPYSGARAEYIASQQLNADRAPALVSLASLAINEQRWADAEELLLQAIKMEPWYVPASVNLADFYRAQQREPEAEKTLKQALTIVPDNADLQLSYGLLLVRQQQLAQALTHLQQASQQSSDPYYHYVYALALQQTGKQAAARAVLDNAAKNLRYSRDVQLARVENAWKEQDVTTATQYLAEWLGHDSQDPAALQWQQTIGMKRP